MRTLALLDMEKLCLHMDIFIWRYKSEISYPFINCKRYSHLVSQIFIKYIQWAKRVLPALRSYKTKDSLSSQRALQFSAEGMNILKWLHCQTDYNGLLYPQYKSIIWTQRTLIPTRGNTRKCHGKSSSWIILKDW